MKAFLFTALLLGACTPTLQGPQPCLYTHKDWNYISPLPKYTPSENATNLAAYYGAVWYAHCQGKPTVNATEGVPIFKAQWYSTQGC